MGEDKPKRLGKYQDPLLHHLARVHRLAIIWLGSIIALAVAGLILITLVDETTISLVLGRDLPLDEGVAVRGTQTDQAIAILGNIAAAGIGGLVGWVSRDFMLKRHGDGSASQIIAGTPLVEEVEE